MASTRGPIKVGSGYIEIIPKLSQTAVSEMRGELTKQMQALGAAAGKEFSRSAEAAMDGLPRAAAAAAKRASSAVQREARDTEVTLSAIEREITKEYGAQAGTRFREAQRLEAEKRKLLEGTSTATRTAVRQIVAEETRAAADSATRWRVAEQGRIQMIQLREREAIRAERAQAAAAAQAEREMRAATRTRMQDQLTALQATRQSLREQVREHQAAMRQMQTYNGSFFSNFQKGWKRAGEGVQRFGNLATETGRLITHNLVGPVGLLAAGLTAVGVKSADSLIQAQTGLHGIGLELKDVNRLLKEMQTYAIKTPYSLQDMQKYSTRYARALASHDEDFQSSDSERKRRGSERVAHKAGDIVEMIGDQAAYGGIMDPNMVSQGMYAAEVILDMGRTPMRNMKQLERATGIPANDLARMYGFKDHMVKDPQNPGKMKRETASAQMYEFMQNAKETGGIEGADLIDKLLDRWRDGKNGIQGSAARMGSATISGRIQQMKESGQVALGKLFYSEKADGTFQYTGLGEAIMGKRGKDGKYEGGLLNDVKGIGKTALKMTPELLEEFFSVLRTFTGWLKSTADFLKEHPGLRDAVLQAAKIAAVAAPFLIGFGIVAKGVGKLAKLMGPAVSTVQDLSKGTRGAVRTGRQFFAGTRSRAEGGSFREGYRAKRTDLRDGDDRGPIRRSADRFMGENSQRTRVQADTSELERQLRDVNTRIDALKSNLREVNTIRLQDVSNSIGADAGHSVRASARDAEAALRQVRTQGTDPLNRERLELVVAAVEGLKERAETAERHVRQVSTAVDNLNGRSTGSVRQEFSYLSQKAETSDSRVRDVYNRMTGLNDRPLKALRQEFDWTEPKIREVRRAIQESIDRMTTLNGKPLKSLRDRFKGEGNSLHSAVGSVNGQLSTTNSRLREVNGARVGDATRSVNGLKGALEKAADKADDLDDKIGKVNHATGRGGGVANPKRTKKALGGVLPGYAPGVDSIPALLSPGEAILRPEVAHHIGAARIDAWNAAAARGDLSRYARGTSGAGKLPFFSNIADLRETFDISQIVSLYGSSVGFMASAHGIGGRTGRNVADWGAEAGGGTAGNGASSKFRGILDWFSRDMPDLLRRTPSGLGQLIGIIAGAVAPSAGKYAWDDIWKGDGNIVQRSGKFLGDLFNPETLWQMVKDLFKGVWDSVKAIVQTAVNTITDPKGAFLEALSQAKSMVTEPLEMLKDTFNGLKEILANPAEYAKQVWDSFYERAKEAMPNTKGLWDFGTGGIVPGYAPGHDTVHARLSPGEAVLRPDAVRALGYRMVLGLNRAAMTSTPVTAEASPASGTTSLDQAVTPVPDAAAVEDAVKRIEEALAAMSAAVEAAVQREQSALGSQTQALRSHQVASDGVWSAIADTVASSIDGEITPAQQRWAQHLQGPLVQAERGFQAANSASWSDVQGKVSGATSSVLGSFGSLQGGLSNLRSFFQMSASEVRSVWGSAMSYVDSSTRSVISGPYNRGTVPMMTAMAQLAGADQPLNPVRYSTGGIVPGYLPGVDTVPAVLSPGEGILRPEVVRALGRDRILEWNEAARRGRNVFARGGIVRPLTGAGTGTDGGGWVRKHEDDPYSGYFEAIDKGWGSVVKPGLDEVSSAFRVSGDLSARSFGKALPWLQKLGKYWDDHLGGGGRVVEVARREYATEAPAIGGAKYTGGSFEAWCADFISYVVSEAGANAQYGNSPHGAPASRWPAVAQWNAAMRHVPVTDARPGDLLTYGGDAHINLLVGPDETIGGNESNGLRHQRGYNRQATAALRPSGSPASDGEPAFKPWPGSIPKGFFPGDGGVGSAQLTQWITTAMGLTGVSGPQWLRGLITLVMRESGGNPRAVNNWDSNAQAGDPSKGLAQVIGSTFRAYHQAGTSWDPFDPVANVAAAINYIRDRYGDISRVQQANPDLPSKGYWTGTKSATAGLAMVGERGPELINFRGGERVYSNSETRDLLGNRYEIHVHEAQAEDTTQAVMRAMQYAEAMHGF